MEKGPYSIHIVLFYIEGDVKAVLVRGNKPYLLTKDHSPLNIKERERVLKNGNYINISSKT